MCFLKSLFSKPKPFPTEQDIIKFLTNKKNFNLTKKDLIHAFGIPEDKTELFKCLLKSMRKKNLIVKTNGNFYYLCDPDADNQIIELEALINDYLEDGVYVGVIDSKHSHDYGKRIVIYASSKQKSYRLGDKVVIKMKKSFKDNKKKRYGKIITHKDERPAITTGIVQKTFTGFDVVPTNKKHKWAYSLLPFDETITLEHGDFVKFSLSDVYSKRHQSNVAYATQILHRKINDIHSISLIALEDNHIPYVFPNAVIQEADTVTEITPDNQTHSKRIDLTHLPFVTIDPKDAKDHDDAVFATFHKTGDATLYVAIADVAAYVTPASKIDLEAVLRGNSVYLPDRVVPMLPERLSNNLCSLKANTVRPVLVAKIEINSNGQKTSHEFLRAFIRCRANVTYEDVYHATANPTEKIRNLNEDNAFDTIIKPLIDVYECLKIAAAKRAPLDLDLPEYKIVLNDDKSPIGVDKKERLFTHRLIEEFMVLANVCAAQTLEEHDMAVVYRSHEEPSLDKIASLNETLKAMGIPFKSKKTVTSKMFNHLLMSANESSNGETIAKMVLRCQSQAVYTPKNQGHFGLNLERYAHFTSPIRRYADLIVHRSLIKALKLGHDGISDDELSRLSDICEHISRTERRAISAEMETKDRFLADLLKTKISQKFAGQISGITNAGLFVRLPEYGAEGFIPIVHLSQFSKKRRYFETNETRHILRDKYSGQYYILGQTIHVTLLEVNLFTGGMSLTIIDESDLNDSETLVGNKLDKKEKKKLGKIKESLKNKMKLKKKDKQKLL